MSQKKVQKSSGELISRREALKRGACGIVGASVLGGLGCGGCRKVRKSGKLNVFLITVDTLRADHLGCYGYARPTTPTIDAFAGDSLVFEKCLSHAPVTSSSLASLLSGFYPQETKVFRNWPLPPPVRLIPDLLKNAGYQTIAVVSNYMLNKKNGWDKHFMIYDDQMTDFEVTRYLPERIAEHTTNRAIKLLKARQEGPLFMWVHYQDPHGPYTPPAEYEGMFIDPSQKERILHANSTLSGRGGIPSYQVLQDHRDYNYYVALYDSEIRYMDDQLGRLLQTMKQMGFYDDALIIFSADHGEGMGEHDYYFAHGECLYQNMLHVPLIMKHGSLLSGRRSDYVQHIDVLPTVCATAGIKTDLPLRGSDLRQKNGSAKDIYAAMNSAQVKDSIKISLVRDGLKIIHTMKPRSFELYDLTKDPAEENNVIKEQDYQPRLRVMIDRVFQLANEDRLGIKRLEKKSSLSEDEKRKLKSLGYVE